MALYRESSGLLRPELFTSPIAPPVRLCEHGRRRSSSALHQQPQSSCCTAAGELRLVI